jgi:hypothetical protein
MGRRRRPNPMDVSARETRSRWMEIVTKPRAKSEQNAKFINKISGTTHPSKVKVAGSIPARVASKIKDLAAFRRKRYKL